MSAVEASDQELTVYRPEKASLKKWYFLNNGEELAKPTEFFPLGAMNDWPKTFTNDSPQIFEDKLSVSLQPRVILTFPSTIAIFHLIWH